MFARRALITQASTYSSRGDHRFPQLRHRGEPGEHETRQHLTCNDGATRRHTSGDLRQARPWQGGWGRTRHETRERATHMLGPAVRTASEYAVMDCGAVATPFPKGTVQDLLSWRAWRGATQATVCDQSVASALRCSRTVQVTHLMGDAGSTALQLG